MPATLLTRWRDENVEYDFVRPRLAGGKHGLELKSHPPLAQLESFRRAGFTFKTPARCSPFASLARNRAKRFWIFAPRPAANDFIAQLMNNQGRIVAQDVSEERLKLIRENCERLGATCVETVVNDWARPHPAPLPQEREQQSSTHKISNRVRFGRPTGDHSPLPAGEGRGEGKLFDRVLVDVPCSNTGVMRRRVDLRWADPAGGNSTAVQPQLNLLKQAHRRVKSDGVLVYSTCSLEPEENQEVVKQFLSGTRNSNWIRVRAFAICGQRGRRVCCAPEAIAVNFPAYGTRSRKPIADRAYRFLPVWSRHGPSHFVPPSARTAKSTPRRSVFSTCSARSRPSSLSRRADRDAARPRTPR